MLFFGPFYAWQLRRSSWQQERGRLKSAPSGASPALAGCHRPDWGRTKSQVLRNIWETVTARHQVDIFLKIKIQPPKSEPREFSISWMWNWSECNYFTLFSAVWLWTKHQLMHKQDLLTPMLIFFHKRREANLLAFIEWLSAIAAITQASSTSFSSGHLNP